MPSQKPEQFELKYTTAPLLIWEVLSYAYLQPLQSQLLNYFIVNSINVFGKKQNIHARKWVELHATEFALSRGCSRQGVIEAVSALIKLGFLEVNETTIGTNSGRQKGRELRLASTQKLTEILDVLRSTKSKAGDKHHLSPQIVDNSQGDRPHLSPRQAPLVTLTGPTCHLVRPCLSPWGVKVPKSLSNSRWKYSLNTFKDFLNTFSKFENSFFELYSESANSKTSVFKIKMQIAALIRRYSLYSVYVAMSVNLFSKDAVIGDLDAISAFLELNKAGLRENEEKIHAHSVDLFNVLLTRRQEITKRVLDRPEGDLSNDLEIIADNFKASASALLSKESIEQSSMRLFFYSSFQEDVIAIFETCNCDLNRFTGEILKKINLYFKFKILGMNAGLSFAQSEE